MVTRECDHFVHTKGSAETLGFIGELLRTRKIEFIASAISHWHAIGVEAALSDFVSTGNAVEGVIIIKAHSKDGFLLSEDDFPCARTLNVTFVLDAGLHIRQGYRICKAWDYLEAFLASVQLNMDRKEKTVLRIISPMHVDTLALKLFARGKIRALYKPRFVVTDEGIGTYFSRRVWNEATRLDRPAELIRPGGNMRYLRGQLIRFIAEQVFPVERHTLFRRTRTGLAPIEEVVRAYQRALSMYVQEVVPKIGMKHPYAMVITSPLSEYQRASLRTEREALGEIIRVLWNLGLGVMVKPHPREDGLKYSHVMDQPKAKGSLVLLKKNQPVERLYASIQPDCVIGYGSTGLITATTLFKIPAFDATRILSHHQDTEFVGGASYREFQHLAGEMVAEFNQESVAKAMIQRNSISTK